MRVSGTAWWARGLRAIFAVLAVAALISPLSDGSAGDVDDYLSYFTILSNIAAASVLAIAAIAAPDSPRWHGVRGAVTTAMSLTGLGYALLLADGHYDWVNTVVHRVVPLVMIVDWCVCAPRGVRRHSPISWMIPPVIYGGYTLIRGALIDWYPYPFFDPRGRGYLATAQELAVILILMAATATAVALLGALAARARRSSDSPHTASS